ncbi:MAG TPA: hypothetical protein VNH46_02740 [Gemmatimonadales bacterium]|nr:hypothetical protein [Gemmatimonadales bacterium]
MTGWSASTQDPALRRDLKRLQFWLVAYLVLLLGLAIAGARVVVTHRRFKSMTVLPALPAADVDTPPTATPDVHVESVDDAPDPTP